MKEGELQILQRKATSQIFEKGNERKTLGFGKFITNEKRLLTITAIDDHHNQIKTVKCLHNEVKYE